MYINMNWHSRYHNTRIALACISEDALPVSTAKIRMENRENIYGKYISGGNFFKWPTNIHILYI